MGSWIILTGEYPPMVGGVAEHARHLAVGLARAGDEVDVWSPAPKGDLTPYPGVRAHRLPDRYGLRSLAILELELAKRPNSRVLVEYVPHVFGMKAMNIPFALWLAAKRRPIWVIFHEVAMQIVRGAPLRLNILGVVTQGMAAVIARSADRLFVSTPAWNDFLRRLAPGASEPVWLPDPSNVPDSVPLDAVTLVRSHLGLSPHDIVIGTFGTYGLGVTDLLVGAFPALLRRDPRRVALLIGRGSTEAAERVAAASGKEARVIATGTVDLPAVAAHLAACAAVIQPYPDGITTRRTSAMASLALGIPLVTNGGNLTEPLWHGSEALALAPEPSGEALARAAESVLSDPTNGASLGARGRQFYQDRFCIERLVHTLQQQ